MKAIKVKLIGINYLLIHNDRAADPLDIYSKRLKEISSKRNKTEADHELMARIEWESALYLMDGEVKIPSRNIERCIEEGGKKNKKGKDIRKFIEISDTYISLKYSGTPIKNIPIPKTVDDIPMKELNAIFAAREHFDRRSVKVGQAKIMRTRPIFKDWSLAFELQYVDGSINFNEIEKACEIAGSDIGLCEHNINRYGRFTVKIIK